MPSNASTPACANVLRSSQAYLQSAVNGGGRSHCPTRGPTAKICLPAAEKLEACENMLQHNRRVGSYMPGFDKKQNAQEQQLQKICRDTNKVANEHIKGISTQVETSSNTSRALRLHLASVC